MMDPEQAERFASEWMDGWNNRDLDAVLAHYAEDVVFHSPRIAVVTGEALHSVTGKAALRRYWTRAFESSPDLRFSLETVLLGSDALTIIYRNHRQQQVAETFIFDRSGLVTRSVATYK
jgi:ketosteroid isomerase-like protein